MATGKPYVAPRNVTGNVPLSRSSSAEEPFSYADGVSINAGVSGSGSCRGAGARTEDFGPRRERCVVGQGFGGVVISAISRRRIPVKARQRACFVQVWVAATLVRTLYSQLSTLSGTPAMLRIEEARLRGSSDHDVNNLPSPPPPWQRLPGIVQDSSEHSTLC